MQQRHLRICVVGAGIMGLSSAYCLAKEYPGSEITVVAEEFPPNTTSNHGYGMVLGRHYSKQTCHWKINEWKGETARYCREITTKDRDLARKMGINHVDGFLVFSKKFLKKIENDQAEESIATTASLRSSCTYFRESTRAEVKEKFLSEDVKFDVVMDLPKEDAKVEDLAFYSCGLFIIDTDMYLLWLKNALEEMAKGGELHRVEFVSSPVQHLTDLCQDNYDVVINCSGLGAGKIADDNLVVPIRAQWMLIRAPDIDNLYLAGETFICPRPGRVAVGSTFQWNRTDRSIDPKDSAHLWARAKALFPDLQKSQVLGEYTRLRPGRIGGARLELEKIVGGNGPLLVIHNYGHGGTGIGQHWGCALEVVKIARTLFSNTGSKL